ncbi:MAG: hypothetical protein HQ541_07135 [Mariniphaga sp.]|nr:hypothetical protein [Mariniphaga sp.]
MKSLKQIYFKWFLLIILVSFFSCRNDYKTIRFNSEMEVSGKKFALAEIAPDLPINWDGYEFVVLEFMITTPQRFHVGFTTETGYNELRVMSYTPNGWNRLAIPLKFYRNLPAARSDLAATYNQPRFTGWINLSGKRSPLVGVDSIGIRMNAPIDNPVIKLRSVTLAKEDPGDQYLGDTPVIDEFGQYNLGEWDDKIFSLEQLQEEWKAEDALLVNAEEYNYSKFGGYLNARIDQGTGFFRTEKIDGRWWFVDPEGYLFLSVGVDCVSPGGGGNAVRIDQRSNLYKELPPEDLGFNSNRRGSASASFGTWNLFRRYGEDYREKSVDNILTRMDRWGINTIANWSSANVYNKNKKTFTQQLRGLGIEGGLMGLADVYAPGFAEKIDNAVKSSVEPYNDNPWLLGYFTYNEPSWLNQESRLCDMILAENDDRPIKQELLNYLADVDNQEMRVKFIHNTFRIFIKTVGDALKRHSNHLNLGIRFGHIPENEILELCKDVFDVFSFNSYDLYPSTDMMDRCLEMTGKPMMIGEYHFGTVDRGMAQALWQVDSQQERGVAYRYYTEKAYSHPGLIGSAYFQWCDQDITGRRNDGENYNCGLVDVTDRPYKYQVEAMSQTAKKLFEVHSGKTSPFDQAPIRARGHREFPDVWNE